MAYPQVGLPNPATRQGSILECPAPVAWHGRNTQQRLGQSQVGQTEPASFRRMCSRWQLDLGESGRGDAT